MRIASRHREGFALAVSLAAIVVIGALIAGAFWSSMQHYRATRNSLSQERALNAAEFGQNWVLANWNGSAAKAMKLGDNVAFTPAVPGGLGTADVRMTRLNQNLFWVVSEGKSGAGQGALLQSRARTNLLLRLDFPNMLINAPVMTAGDWQQTGASSTISGVDQNPPGWGDCAAAGAAKPAIANDNPASEVQTPTGGGCAGEACLFGASPKIATDPNAGLSSTYNSFGGITWDTLTAWAQANYPSKVYTASGTGWKVPGNPLEPSGTLTTCNTAAADNWGAPIRPNTLYPECEKYYPIIWIKGATATTRIDGNSQGQGILLVEGNLEIAGTAQFNGIIIAKGTVYVTGSGGVGGGSKVIGAILAGGSGSTSTGNSSITYSSCAINEALAQQNPPPVPVTSRPWGDMY